MRVAALYDIHGNLPALEAVLEDCLLNLDVPIKCIRGNGDREALTSTPQNCVQLRHTRYDLAAAAERIRGMAW